MKNVEMSVGGNILTLIVDLAKDFGTSSSGDIDMLAYLALMDPRLVAPA